MSDDKVKEEYLKWLEKTLPLASDRMARICEQAFRAGYKASEEKKQ